MKTHPVQPARLTRNAQGVPFSEAYGDVYHPAGGALAQARHVFLEGNGLPERWQGRDRFVILETGFGLGNNFLATWDAWRSDPQAPRVLHFISLERHPLTRDDLAQVPRDHTLAGLAASLVEAWPPLTPNVHRLMFEGDRVELLLALGDVHEWLPQMVAHVDAFFLDGFAPARNPQMWQPALFKAMARMAAPGATFATWSAARAVRDGLTAAGFDVQRADGQGGKRDITVGRYAPRFTPRAAAARFGSRPAGHAVIVGAGLAGCGAARALAQEGWRCTVLDARDHPAQEGSGNPAGMFHGIVHADDGSHARFNRAAALAVRHAVLRAIEHGVPGGVPGLLRLETGIGVPAMQAVIERLGLPPEYVQALTPEAASAHAGVPLTHPAWLYPGGGWVSPAALSRHWLAEVGGGVRFVGGMRVGSLRQRDHGWEVLDAQGVSIETANVVILANAVDAARLAGGDWPQHRVRGQVSLVDPARLPIRPRMPIAGAGYLVVPLQAPAVFGATAQPGDADESVREADHCYNLGQLQRLLDRPFDIGLDQLGGRTGWRCVVEDRLPLIGAVPDSTACNPPRDQARLVPRVPGLYVFAGMGSRGITWSALGARVLASWVTGAPAPVEADLLDAVDPARFVVRRLRRAAREPR
jgi:tRNA 5-methylaminomethyl-2-thiouridine biosynthesis bifunctional protein